MFNFLKKGRYDSFKKNYKETQSWTSSNSLNELWFSKSGFLKEFLQEFGGKSFNQGLYRVYAPGEIEAATERMGQFFQEYKNKMLCFGYDWLGSHFALDLQRQEGGEPLILLFDPGVGQAMEIPVTLERFHNVELVENPGDAVAAALYNEWFQLNRCEIKPNQCVGYKKPLFLGGEDDVSNLELSDMDVYLEICSQLYNKTKNLPQGTVIKDINIQ